MPVDRPPQDQPLSVASAILQTADLERLRDFYQRILGLETLSSDGEEAELGAGGRRLLTLRLDRSLKTGDHRGAGLFHLAFLLPTRGDLARWLRAASRDRAVIEGASDHGVSEALYLSDPDGNGVEVYRDLPAEEWPRRPDGALAMKTDYLDLQALLRSAPDAQASGQLHAPAGTVLGHAHLQVGALEPVSTFYQELGFAKIADYPGAAFLGSGGYHHHVALNTWRSRGAGALRRDMVGLAGLRLTRLGAKQTQTMVDPIGLTLTVEPR